MKKIMLSFLTLILALGLCVGCIVTPGGSSEAPSSDDVSSSAPSRPSKNSSDDESEEESEEESMESVDQDPYASDIY